MSIFNLKVSYLGVLCDCKEQERAFLTWFIQYFVSDEEALPSPPSLQALHDYGVLDSIVVPRDKHSIPSILFQNWWRHPAQVVMLLSAQDLKRMLRCSSDIANGILSRCAFYRHREVVTLQKSLQRPLIKQIQSPLCVRDWDMKAWSLPMPAAVPASSMPVVTSWASFRSEQQLLERDLDTYKDCIFPERHGLDRSKTPYSYASADHVWVAASDAVNRVCRYLAYTKESQQSAGILAANKAPQWFQQGLLPCTYIQDMTTRQVPASTLAAEAACLYRLPEFVLRADARQGKALSACDMSMGSLLLWQGEKDAEAPMWVKKPLLKVFKSDSNDWVLVGAIDILGVCRGEYEDCPIEVVGNMQHAAHKVMTCNSARGIRYSLLGNGLFVWAVMMTEDQQMQMDGPWAVNATEPTVCQVIMTITHLAINAEKKGNQQPWTIAKASSMPAAAAVAKESGVVQASHSLPDLPPAGAQEVSYADHCHRLTAATQPFAIQGRASCEGPAQCLGLLSASGTAGCTAGSLHNPSQQEGVLSPYNADTHASDSSSSHSHHSIASAGTTKQAHKRSLHQDGSDTEEGDTAKRICFTSDENNDLPAAQASVDDVEKNLAANAKSIKFDDVVGVIAHGSSGFIFSYRAPDTASTNVKLWALKIAPEKYKMGERLKHAGTVMQKLKGIVPDVVAMGPCADGGYVLATEQVINCSTYIKEHTKYSDNVQKAVSTMHQAGVIHGNLLAQHILMDQEGKVLLTGFGQSTIGATQHGIKMDKEDLEIVFEDALDEPWTPGDLEEQDDNADSDGDQDMEEGSTEQDSN